MSALKLKQFEKQENEKLVSTCIKITSRQSNFIRARNLNLSKVVRVLLDELIKENGK